MANNHLLQGHFHSPHLRVRRTQSTQRLCSPLTMHPCAPTFSTGSNIPNSRTQYRAIFLSQHILQVLLIELIFPLLCKEEGQYHLLHWPGAPRGAKADAPYNFNHPFSINNLMSEQSPAPPKLDVGFGGYGAEGGEPGVYYQGLYSRSLLNAS